MLDTLTFYHCYVMIVEKLIYFPSMRISFLRHALFGGYSVVIRWLFIRWYSVPTLSYVADFAFLIYLFRMLICYVLICYVL